MGEERAGKDASTRGDRVEIVIDAGGGVRKYDVVATRAGRRVEITHGRRIVEVTEVTRVTTARAAVLVERTRATPTAESDETERQSSRACKP